MVKFRSTQLAASQQTSVFRRLFLPAEDSRPTVMSNVYYILFGSLVRAYLIVDVFRSEYQVSSTDLSIMAWSSYGMLRERGRHRQWMKLLPSIRAGAEGSR